MEELTLVTNSEVLESLLRTEGEEEVCKSKEMRWLSKRLKSYIKENPEGKENKVENSKSFIEEVKRRFTGKSQLTPAEILQLVNLAPRSEAMIHLIVDCCEERLSIEQVQDINELVKTYLFANQGSSTSE